MKWVILVLFSLLSLNSFSQEELYINKNRVTDSVLNYKIYTEFDAAVVQMEKLLEVKKTEAKAETNSEKAKVFEQDILEYSQRIESFKTEIKQQKEIKREEWRPEIIAEMEKIVKAKKKQGKYKKVTDTSHQTPPGYNRKYDLTKEIIKELCTE